MKKVTRFRPKKKEDIIGKTFNLLTPVKRLDLRQHGHAIYNCVCSACGGFHKMRRDSIVSGKFKCRYWSHGLSNSLTYKRYKAVYQRCNNPKHKGFRYYGARGVELIPKSFVEFLETFGPCPGTEYQLARKGDTGSYELGNAMWVTRDQNIREAAERRKASAQA